MKELLEFRDVPVLIERKARRKRISLFVYPDRPITVRTHISFPKGEILSFLEQRWSWVEKQKSRFLAQEKLRQRPRLLLGQKFLWCGQDKTFQVVVTPNEKRFFSMNENEIFLHIPLSEWGPDAREQEYGEESESLNLFFRRRAEEYLSRRTSDWSKHTGLRPTKFSINETRSRWGSCSSSGQIRLNWKLIFFDAAIVDYVIVHELCHLRHLNHSKSFWTLVENFLPDYAVRNKKLKSLERGLS